MRPSNRTAILEAAVSVIERDGITSVTFDSVSAASGVTRSGIIYHFPSREDMVGAIHAHLAQQWERHLEAACGKPASEASATERLAAYIRVCATAATRGELQMLLDSPHSEHQQAWDQVVERWIPERVDAQQTGPVGPQALALLAADGLWVNEAINQSPMSPERRAQVAEAIVAMLETR